MNSETHPNKNKTKSHLGLYLSILHGYSIYLPENSKMEQIVNGSIRSASTISSRDCERNANLVRYIFIKTLSVDSC